MSEVETIDPWDTDGPTPWDLDAKFRAWIHELDEDVIQGKYGYERGEFTVYAEAWHPHYLEGLTPQQSFKRALDAAAEDRKQRERERLANWERIKAADTAFLKREAADTATENGKT
jgi:hypothetical protein